MGRSAVDGAKSAMRAAKAKAIEARSSMRRYLSPSEIEAAKHAYRLKRKDLQGVLDKVVGGTPQKKEDTTAPAPASMSTTTSSGVLKARKAAQHAKATEIGNAAAQKIIQATFGQKATQDEIEGVPRVEKNKAAQGEIQGLAQVEKNTLVQSESGVHFIYDGSG